MVDNDFTFLWHPSHTRLIYLTVFGTKTFMLTKLAWSCWPPIQPKSQCLLAGRSNTKFLSIINSNNNVLC